jgi:5-aminopentanamidase
VRVAVWQPAPAPRDPEGALARLDEVLGRAAGAGADVLVAPEMLTSGYDISAADTRALAEPADGPTARRVQELSSRHGVAVAYGFPEAGLPDDGRSPSEDGSPSEGVGSEDAYHRAASGHGDDARADAGDGGHEPARTCPIYNAANLIDGDQLLLTHRKMQLFGHIDRARFTPGPSRPGVASLRGRMVSLLICFDVEFPETVRSAAHTGADLVLVPTANMRGFETVNRVLVPARAIENGVSVAYANWVGPEGAQDYCGLSAVAAPDGTVQWASEDDEDLLVANIPEPTLRGADEDHLSRLRRDLFG